MAALFSVASAILAREDKAHAREVRWLGSVISDTRTSAARVPRTSRHIGTRFAGSCARWSSALSPKALAFGLLASAALKRAGRAPPAELQIGTRFEGAAVSSCSAARAKARGLRAAGCSSSALSTKAARRASSSHMDRRFDAAVARFQSVAMANSWVRLLAECVASSRHFRQRLSSHIAAAFAFFSARLQAAARAAARTSYS
mmetsp:Transcript_56544/g.165359  ORF Transcript_56544/g.165359 Transcript_56544/m.165359 type:complete len:202 (-) Transcript_56544:840-1445(-)